MRSNISVGCQAKKSAFKKVKYFAFGDEDDNWLEIVMHIIRKLRSKLKELNHLTEGGLSLSHVSSKSTVLRKGREKEMGE